MEDVFNKGEVGGRCEFDSELHGRQGEHKSPLQSWYAELEQYTELKFRPDSDENCDEIVTRPTVFIKLDAGVWVGHSHVQTLCNDTRTCSSELEIRIP